MKKSQIPKPLLERVEDELLSGEHLLWVGQPNRKHVPNVLSAPEAILAGITLALFLAGVMAFMVLERSAGQDSPLIWLVMMLIPAIAIVAAIVKMLNDTFGTKHLAYAITNRRAMILSQERVQSYAAKDQQFIERMMHRDGTGDIVFREDHVHQLVPAGGAMMHRKQKRVTTGFYGIANPAEVEALMLETFHEKEKRYDHLSESTDGDESEFEYVDNYNEAKSYQ